MAYQYPQTQQNPKSRIQTDGVQLYGVNNTMRLDWWNEHASFKIFPKKDQSDGTGGVYNYKVRTTLTMTAESAIVLGRLIREEIIPASKNNEAKHLGIQSSKMNIIYVSNGIEEFGSLRPFIGLYCGIDETRKPTNVAVFEFTPRRIFTSYNPTTGDFASEEKVLQELEVVADFLLSAVNIFGASAHSYDCDHAFDIERDDAFRSAIGNKLGVQYAQPVNYVNRSSYQNGNDPWSTGGASAQPKETSAPEANTSTASMDDLNSLLAGAKVIRDVKGMKKHLLYGDKIKLNKIKFIS
jgi:hypothetical protein